MDKVLRAGNLPRMRILDRYIGWQILLTTIIAVIVLTGVVVLGSVMKQLETILGNTELPPGVITEFILNILPFSLTFTIPWGFLTAILLTFGRLSADNEVVAIRMAGQSMLRICTPVFVLAITFCSICYWVNVSIGPEAQGKTKRLLYEVATDDPLAFFQAGRVIDKFPNKLIYTGAKEGNELKDLEIHFLDGRRVTHSLNAKHATLNHQPGSDEFELELHEALLVAKNPEDEDNLGAVQTGKINHRVDKFSLAELKEKTFRPNPTVKNTATLKEELRTGIEGNTQEPLGEEQRAEWKAEVSKRYSFSMACFTFALIGIPLGVTAQRRETSIGFVFSLIVGSVYFFFIIIANSLRSDPDNRADLLMWVPNVIFIALGLYLFRRLSRK